MREVLSHAARVIGEAKNVRSLSYTSQLRDFVAYAKQQGYKFEAALGMDGAGGTYSTAELARLVAERA